MTKDIVSKLREHLLRPMETEPDVMYLLAEVRKLLDKDKKKENGKPEPVPFALKMYCHWALHVDLTGLDTTREFLLPIDELMVNTIAGFAPDPGRSQFSSSSIFWDLIYSDTFRSQRRDFLAGYALPTDLFDVDARWFRFLVAFGGLFAGGHLSIRDHSPLRPF